MNVPPKHEPSLPALRRWLGEHSFGAYLTAFLLMSVPPLPLYFAARAGASEWIWLLLGLVILGNGLVLLLK